MTAPIKKEIRNVIMGKSTGNLPYAQIPAEAALDRRLKLADLRVLIALYSFKGKKGTFPTREKISERTGYTVQNISRITSNLVRLGWLKKEGSGGYSKASVYTLVNPDIDSILASNANTTMQTNEAQIKASKRRKTVSRTDTVSVSDTVSKPDTKTVSVTDTKTVSRTDTRIVTDQLTDQLTDHNMPVPTEQAKKAKPKKRNNSTKKKPISAEAWKAYEESYIERYGVTPLRNVQVNSQLAKFVQKVGQELAPKIIRFYLTHNNSWYVQKRHDIGNLLVNAQAIYVDMMRNEQMTQRKAQQSDNLQTQANVWDNLLKKERQQ